MTPEQLENLTQNASMAADFAAIDEMKNGASQAQVIRRVVRRTIEFLVGNGLIEVKSDGNDEWLTLEPPYPHWPESTDSGV